MSSRRRSVLIVLPVCLNPGLGPMGRLTTTCEHSRWFLRSSLPTATYSLRLIWTLFGSPNWPESEIDLSIVELAEPAPPEIPQYPLYGGQGEYQREIVVAGYGATGHGVTGADLLFDAQPTRRAGLNRYEELVFNEFGTEYMLYDFDSGLPGKQCPRAE